MSLNTLSAFEKADVWEVNEYVEIICRKGFDKYNFISFCKILSYSSTPYFPKNVVTPVTPAERLPTFK